MKLFIILFVFMFSFQLCGGRSAAQQSRVYICLSGTAYAYHDNINCRGLRSCTHKIDTVDISTARNRYKRKACGYCY